MIVLVLEKLNEMHLGAFSQSATPDSENECLVRYIALFSAKTLTIVPSWSSCLHLMTASGQSAHNRMKLNNA